MPQVSRRLIRKNIEDQIQKILNQSITLCDSSSLSSEFTDDLFTPTEKIMLAKRIAIAYLLIKGYSYTTIESTLKVSDSTIGYIALILKTKGNGLRKIIKKLESHKQWKNLLDDLGELALQIFGSSSLIHNKSLTTFKYQRRLNKTPLP